VVIVYYNGYSESHGGICGKGVGVVREKKLKVEDEAH